MILNFQKEINLIMYIIEFLKKINSNVECNVTYSNNKWGGLMVKVFVSIPKVKGSNLMNGVVCGQQWYVDQIFSYRMFRISA
jgi:hypothetical protein